MFPIPWNFPFRKKDGTIGKIEDLGGQFVLPTASADTKGGVKIGNRLTMNGEVLNADAQLPAITPDDIGKVLTVGDEGSLEWDTKGEGGGDYYLKYDFTKFGSRTGPNGAVFSSSGVSIASKSAYLSLLYPESYNDITFYLDVGEMNLTGLSDHKRFFMIAESSGLIYRYTGKWDFYNGSTWSSVDSGLTDPNYFANSKLKIYIDSNNYWHIYKNNVLIYEPGAHGALGLSRGYCLGSYDQSCNNVTITSLRIYNGNYTEA